MRASSKNEKDGVVALAKNVIFVLAIYAYFIGWVYSYYLFHHFGITLTSVEIPFYFFFIYSYPVIESVIESWLALAIVFVISSVVYLLTVTWHRPVVVVVILVAMFPLAFSYSRDEADRQARLMRDGYNVKPISLTFKDGAARQLPKEFIEANKDRELKLITQTPGRLFILYQSQGESSQIPSGFTYIISKEDVLTARIEMINISKVEVRNEP